MHAWSTVCTPHTFLLKRCGTWSQFAHRSSPSVHKAAMAKSNMIIVVAMCLLLGLSLQGCASCDKEAYVTCASTATTGTDVCAKTSGCANDNGCCSEDGMEASMKTICTAKPADNKCA